MSGLDTAIAWAEAQIGQPYLYGGEGNGGFDCSGLIQMAFRAAGVALPRTAQSQYDATQRVSIPQPGDLVFYGTSPTNVSHVGLYLGGGKMLDAPHTGAAVRVENVWSGVIGYGRPITGAGATDSATAQLVVDTTGSGSTTSSSTDDSSATSGWQKTLTRIGVEGVMLGGAVLLAGLGLWKGTRAGRHVDSAVQKAKQQSQQVAGNIGGAGGTSTSEGAAAGGGSLASELPEAAAAL